MDTTEKIVRFSIDLGNGISFGTGQVDVYRIDEDAAITVAATGVSKPQFDIKMNVNDASYYYIVAEVDSYKQNDDYISTGDRVIQIVAMFAGTDDNVTVNLQSTIASAYALIRMTRIVHDGTIFINGAQRKIRIAHGMKNNFIGVDGALSNVITSSPNGLETNSYPLFNFLSNLLYHCLIDENVYTQFLTLASSGQSCMSFYQALTYLIKAPFTKVKEIYDLISIREQIFLPSLPTLSLPPHKSPMPDQWTLTIKANYSGAQNFGFAGAAYVVFDKDDKAWIANNVRQGTAFSTTWCIVLNHDGSPADISPISGGGILGPGFGVAADAEGENIAFGNFGWGGVPFNPQKGSVSIFGYNGQILSPPNGHVNKLSRVQGLAYDKLGNLWMASWGTQDPMPPVDNNIYDFKSENSAVVVYPGGDPSKALFYDNFGGTPSPYHMTFDVVIDSEGNALVSNAGSGANGIPASVYKFQLQGTELVCIGSWTSDYTSDKNDYVGAEDFRQVQVNANDEVFVAAITSSRVTKLTKELKYPKAFETNINAAWGVTIDGAGTMYVANFAQEKGRDQQNGSLDMQGPYGVTVITGEDESTARIMTLPTGGDEVMLPSGQPLYGSQRGPCYEPLMRLTSTGIDAAGNLWAMNNWKPAAYVDVKDNPGGDGVVIFVGAAEPL